MAFDGTLKFDTAIDKTGFKLGLNSLGSLAKTGMAAVTAAVTAATGAVAALGGYAVNVGKGFESSMAQVIATMGITKDTIQDGINSYDLLKDAAAKAGESTVFSASEAADALNYLALAGYSASQAADALPAVLNLASAGGMELAYASDLATDAMAALGITANQTNLTHFGDQLAKTASRANANVSQLGEAILTVGGTAKQLAGGTTELNTALGILANVGIKGSEGGTALRNIILAMTPTTDDAVNAFERLGVSAYDAQGDLRPLNETFRDLNDAMADLTTEERNYALNDIFNKVDLKSASAMLSACASSTAELGTAFEYAGVPAERLADFLAAFNDGVFSSMTETEFMTAAVNDFGVSSENAAAVYAAFVTQLNGVSFEKLYNEVKDCDGAMAQMSETMNDTLEGDLKALNSKAEAFGVTIYDSLNSPLRELVQLGGDYVSRLNQALSEGDFSGLASSLGSVAADAVATLAGYVPQLVDMGVELTQSLIRGLTDNAPQILDSLLSAAETLILGVFAVSGDLIELGKTLILSLISGITQCLPDVLTAAFDLIDALIEGLLAILPEIAPAAIKIVETLAQALSERLPELIPMLFELLYGIIGVLTDPTLLTTLISAAGIIITAFLDGLMASAPQVWGYIPQIVINIFDVLSEAVPMLSQLGIDLISQLADGMAENSPALLSALGEIGAAMLDGIGGYFSSILDYSGSLWSDLLSYAAVGLSGIWNKLTGWFADSISAAKRSASDLVSGAMEFLDELPGKIGEMLGNTLGTITSWAMDAPQLAKNAASDFIDNAIEFLSQLPSKSKQQLDDTIRKVSEFGTELCTRGKKAADDLVSKIVETVTALPQKMRETGKNLVEGLWNGITGAGDWLKSKISSFGNGIIDGFKESFGIHSPSTVMRDSVGKFLAQGIGVGFVQEMAHVGSDIVQATEDIIPDIDLEPPDIPDAPKITVPAPEVEVQDAEIPVPELDIPDMEIPKIKPPDISVPDLDIPKIEPLDISVPDPEINVHDIPKLEINAPDVEIPDIELNIPQPTFDVPDIPKIRLKLPDIDAPEQRMIPDAGALNALELNRFTMNSDIIQPSPTSEITNNYSYSTVNNSAASAPEQNISIHATIAMDSEIIAEGVAETALSKIDEQQGITITMKKRGAAR